MGSGAASAQTADYYGQLRADLEAQGVSGGEFAYADSAAATLDAFSISSSGVETTEFQAEGMPFSDAVRIENTEEPANPYSFPANVTDREVEVGDVFLLVAYARGTNAADVGKSVKTQAGFKIRYQGGFPAHDGAGRKPTAAALSEYCSEWHPVLVIVVGGQQLSPTTGRRQPAPKSGLPTRERPGPPPRYDAVSPPISPAPPCAA